MVNQQLSNPVFNALCTGDRHLSLGTAQAKYFEEEVSPFAGFADGDAQGFSALHDLLPPGRKILYAIPSVIQEPEGWQLQHEIPGLQFVYEGQGIDRKKDFDHIQPLTEAHVKEMIGLVRLTRPGPFGKRTIDFGSYYGIVENGQLAAMTGQRLHINDYSEISAVCTHPDHLGKGYATDLLQHQLQIILNDGQKPFLHVRADNERAIGVYERLGFRVSRPMNFYFMKRV